MKLSKQRLRDYSIIQINNQCFVCFFLKIMKIELQLITAALLSMGGMAMLFCGVFIDPQGQIHDTLLIAFGEVATFAGALFGIDYVYKKRK